MSEPATRPSPGGLLEIYDRALPQVYGYLLARTRTPAVAEDVTAEVFLAAARAERDRSLDDLTIAWLMTVARNKLVDHWRKREREERTLKLVHDASSDTIDDDWDQRLDAQRARDTLKRLGAHHQAVLTLRSLDGLSVPEVADQLGRTVHATEALLMRAKRAFRARYEEEGDDRV